MPTDRFGIPYRYPSKPNGFNYEMSDNPKSDNYVDWPSEMSFPGGGVVKMSPNGPTDFGIGRHVPAFLSDNCIGGCGMDFPSTAQRGYAYKADDARDVELTCLAKFDIPSGNGFSISACTGRHSSSGCCQSFAYMGTLEPGDSPPWMRFRKETTHPNYDDSPNSPFKHSKFGSSKISGSGRYVGLKFIRYNKPVGGGGVEDNHVVVEYWFNPNPDADLNDWTRVGQEEDQPGFGWTSKPGACGGDDDQVGPWSSAQNRFKTNATSGSITFKAISMREIDPFGSFENQPPGGTTTTYTRKMFYAVVTTQLSEFDDLMTTICHETTEALSDPDPFARFLKAGWWDNATGNEIADICDNVRGTYGDGLVLSGYWSNSDNSCVVPHVVESDQGSSSKMSSHSGPILKNAVIYLIFWGDVWRTRAVAPTMTGITTRTQNQMLGTDKEFFAKLSQYGGINTPTWGGACLNNFYAIPSGNDVNADASHNVIIDTLNRKLLPLPDETNENLYIVIVPWGLNIVDAKSSILGEHDVFKGTISIFTPPPTPTCPSDQHWDSNRAMCVPNSTTPPPPTPTPPPPSPTRVQGFFSLRWDINVRRGAGACQGSGDSGSGSGGGGPSQTLSKVYDVAIDQDKELSNTSKYDYRIRLAEKVNQSDSVLVDIIPQQFDIPLKRVGSPTGNIYASIYDSSNNPNILYTSPTVVDASTLGTSFTTKIFDFSTNTRALRLGDHIGVKFDTHSSENYVVGSYGDNNTSRSIMSQYEKDAWEDKSSRDLSCTIWQ